MATPQNEPRTPVGLVIGSAFVALAGVLMIVATFLTWIDSFGSKVEGHGGRATYSGWDLSESCHPRGGLAGCTLSTSEDNPVEVFTGAWTLALGALLLAVGVTMLVYAMTTQSIPPAARVAGWILVIVVSIFAVVLREMTSGVCATC